MKKRLSSIELFEEKKVNFVDREEIRKIVRKLRWVQFGLQTRSSSPCPELAIASRRLMRTRLRDVLFGL